MLLETSAATAQLEVKDRQDIADKYKWDLSMMYPSSDAFNKHYAEVEGLIDELVKLEGTAGGSPEALLKVLKLSDQIGIQLEKVYAYATMMHHQDTRDSDHQALEQKASVLYVKYTESASWLTPELSNLPQDQVNTWLQSGELATYKHFFHDLFRSKEHILSPREEELLAMSAKAANSAEDIFSLLTNAELPKHVMKTQSGEEVVISPGVYGRFLYSKNRDERRDAYLGFMQSYIDIKNTLASTLAGTMHRDWYYAKARGYSSCLEASLDRENLPVSVYHNLIEGIEKHLHLLHRFAKMKKRILGVDELHPYDLYVSLIDMPPKSFTYEEGCELVLEGIAPLGKEYVEMMRTGLSSRWIDVYENKGKRGGAYNMGTYLSAPYVLLNFNGTFSDVSTIAHEMGHAMQSHFAAKNQPPVYSGYPMFTAEVASTAAEIVFKRYMLDRTSDKKEKAALIYAMLEDIRTTVFRQTKFAEFDLRAHQMAEQGEPITADGLMEISREIFQKYYGDILVLDAESDIECLRIPHYYRNFYVYRYATSYAAATALAKRIMDAEQSAIDDFMKFLKIGNSMYAIDMLKVAGVDMSTSKPVEDCMAVFEQLLDELEALLDEVS